MKDVCPRCKSNMEMTVASTGTETMPVKGCRKCGGFIADYSGAAIDDASSDKKSPKKLSEKPQKLSNKAHKPLTETCPVCEGEFELVSLNFDLINEALYLDQCSGCGGIWFDKGELSAIFDFALKEAMAVGEFTEDFETISESNNTFFDCPRCNIKRTAYEGLILDMKVTKCKTCNGIWISDGQFEKMVGDMRSYDTVKIDPSEIKSQGEGAKPVSGSCPKCKIALKKWENMPESIKDLYVDYCHKCNGLWFDKGEFRTFFKVFGESPFQAINASLTAKS